jgi:beta-lactam-binding protein with PASTA domain
MKAARLTSFYGSIVMRLCCALLLTGSLFVADGQAAEPFAAPKLTGERVSTARQLTELAGCELVVGEFLLAPGNWREDLLPGVIYLQSPQPLTSVKPGSVLAGWTFRQATADQPVVTMPDLRKLSWSEAKDRLSELKLPLMMRAKQAAEADAPAAAAEATVTNQYPRPDQKVFEGTAVYLQMSE